LYLFPQQGIDRADVDDVQIPEKRGRLFFAGDVADPTDPSPEATTVVATARRKKITLFVSRRQRRSHTIFASARVTGGEQSRQTTATPQRLRPRRGLLFLFLLRPGLGLGFFGGKTPPLLVTFCAGASLPGSSAPDRSRFGLHSFRSWQRLAGDFRVNSVLTTRDSDGQRDLFTTTENDESRTRDSWPSSCPS
jgi:hypothetical protein